MDWRLAKSLTTLREEVNMRWPDRSQDSDGAVGDAAHASRDSDHNPWVRDPPGPNVVTAIDITHDPAHGFDSYAFADWLRQSRDDRVKYVISNSRIFSATVSPWQWRPYHGANPHDHHVHVSVKDVKAFFDNTRRWDTGSAYIPPSGMPPPKPIPPILRNGSNGDAVKLAQRELNRAGFELVIDGAFGPDTEADVRTFQKHSGIKSDGIIGPQTWKALLNL